MTSELSEELKQKMIDNTPLKRMGAPEDVAAAVKFLASDEAAFITGHVLDVNGGIYISMRKRDDKFKIGLVQMSCSTSPDTNLSKAIAGVRDAAAKGAEIICLQELFRSQYFCREENAALFDLAETIPGPSTEAIGSVAKELGVAVVASLFEKRAQGLYHNTAAIIDADGSLNGIYRKMHIPDDPLYFEKFYFTPGDLGFKNFETHYSRIGVLVCWDQWYRRAHGSPACRERTCSSIRPRSDGIHRKKRSMARRSWMRGARFSEHTRFRTACLWRP